MSGKPDDFDAAKTIVQTLEPFEEKEKEKILRWVCEKLGIVQQTLIQTTPQHEVIMQTHTPNLGQGSGGSKDIKAFLAEKSPKSDNQLAAAVAYYYMFEAPANEKKTSINQDDLQNACRLGGMERLKKPYQTLLNAHNVGVLDKSDERGSFCINSVGENLVAMTMPSSTGKVKKSAKKAPRKKKK